MPTDTVGSTEYSRIQQDADVLTGRLGLVQRVDVGGGHVDCARHPRRRDVGRLAWLPWEVIGETLLAVDDETLLTCSALCRDVAGYIASANCWYRRFVMRCKADPDWRVPPAHCLPSNWKRFYWQYRRELARPTCIVHRSDVSRRCVWRVGSLKAKLAQEHHDSAAVVTHHQEQLRRRQTEEVTTRWQLQLQRCVKDDKEHVGVFLFQDQPSTTCFFSLGILNHDYTPIKRYTARQCFEVQSRYGWFFKLDELEAAGMRGELIVEMDVTVFPTGVSRVAPLYKVLQCPDTDETLKNMLVSSLAEYANRTAPNPDHAKRHLQVENPGPLVDAFESPKTSSALKCTIAMCLWNILDISTIYIASDMLDRIIRAACEHLAKILDELEAPGAGGGRGREPVGGLEKRFHTTPAPSVIAAEEPLTFTYPSADQTEPHSSYAIEHHVNSLCGIMWNIPVTPEHRALLVSCDQLLPSLVRVLARSALRKSHFCCLQTLCTLKLNGCIPAASVPSFERYVARYLAQTARYDDPDNGGRDRGQELGVLLSLRDVAEFFCPLLFSKDLTCIAFAQWAIWVFYYGQIEMYGF